MPMGHFTMPPEPPRFQGSTDVRAMVELAKAFNDSKFASQIKLLEDHQRACEVAYELAGAAGEIMRLREAAKEAYQKARDTVHDAVLQQLGVNLSDVVCLQPGKLPKTSSGTLQRRRSCALYLAGQLGAMGARASGGGRFGIAKHLARSQIARTRFRLSTRFRGQK